MLRNIPNKYTQPMLLSVVNSTGFTPRCFDFFYLPIDFRNNCNFGYAFINLRNGVEAQRFFQVFDGYKLPGFNSDKICQVRWARVQGFESNIHHYRNSPVVGVPIPQYRPLIYESGLQVPFPERSDPCVDREVAPEATAAPAPKVNVQKTKRRKPRKNGADSLTPH
jgi:hypothetical protein